MLAVFLMHSQNIILWVSFLHPVFPFLSYPSLSPFWLHVNLSFPELDQDTQRYRRIEGLTCMWLGVFVGRMFEINGSEIALSLVHREESELSGHCCKVVYLLSERGLDFFF
jgi:hypothetical protein